MTTDGRQNVSVAEPTGHNRRLVRRQVIPGCSAQPTAKVGRKPVLVR